MAEYIEREVAIKIVGNIDTLNSYDDIVDEVIAAIQIIPAADVAPVQHGRWEIVVDEDPFWGDMSYPMCSKCGSQELVMTPCCPQCGAEMEYDEHEMDGDLR